MPNFGIVVRNSFRVSQSGLCMCAVSVYLAFGLGSSSWLRIVDHDDHGTGEGRMAMISNLFCLFCGLESLVLVDLPWLYSIRLSIGSYD